MQSVGGSSFYLCLQPAVEIISYFEFYYLIESLLCLLGKAADPPRTACQMISNSLCLEGINIVPPEAHVEDALLHNFPTSPKKATRISDLLAVVLLIRKTVWA